LSNKQHTIEGIGLAVLATLVWSGNFIVARAINQDIPPFMLALLRWGTASIIMLPIGWAAFRQDWAAIKKAWPVVTFAAFTGISLFNTFIYVAGHFSSAISLALIGTTSSPVFSFILARIFLKERIPAWRMLGLLICIGGILLLLSRGSLEVLLHFRFTQGDWWILAAALSFAMYNIATRKKPASISPKAYLFSTFWIGTIILLPFALLEVGMGATVNWSWSLAGIVLYLGAGASVISFLCWNIAIARLGAARTAIFGNLIPVFSSIEAVLILHEKITWIHILGMTVVIVGLVIANLRATAAIPKR